MSNITKSMIQQALMINETTEVRANVDRERPFSHAQVLQAFISAHTRGTHLQIAYLPKDRQLDVIDLLPVTIHNSTSQPAYRNRQGYIVVSNRQRITQNPDGTKTLANSNPAMVKLIREVSITNETGQVFNNPFNSLMVVGHFRLTLVPSEINDPIHIKAFNACSEKLIKAHYLMVANCEEKGIDVDTDAAYRKAIEPLYADYQNKMAILLNNGYASVTQAIVAEESKLMPALTLNSGINLANPFLNAREITKECSFIPTLNEFFGSASVISSADRDDINPALTTGLRSLKGSRNKEEAENSDRGTRQECSRLANVHDKLGNPTSIIIRRLDTGYHNSTSNTKSVAESFESNTANNQNLMIRGSLTPMAIEEGVNASVNGLTRAAIVVDEYRTAANTSLSANSSFINDSDINEINLESMDDVNAIVASVGDATFNFDDIFASSPSVSHEAKPVTSVSTDNDKPESDGISGII